MQVISHNRHVHYNYQVTLYLLFKVDVHKYLYHVFLQNVVIFSVQFVEIKCVEHDITLQTASTEVETAESCFNPIVTDCFQHMCNVNTGKITCHVYRVSVAIYVNTRALLAGRKMPCCGTHLVSQNVHLPRICRVVICNGKSAVCCLERGKL